MKDKSKVLVTGVTGFVGGAFVKVMQRDKMVLGLRERQQFRMFAGYECRELDVEHQREYASVFKGIDTVIHFAGLAHLRNPSKLENERFYTINHYGTFKLAQAASLAGVKHFIYVSTIKVLGEEVTSPGFEVDSPYGAIGHYAISKMRAEESLKELSKSSSMAVSVVRPPLVCALSAKANLKALSILARYGIPIPCAKNVGLRSIVSLENLVDFIRYLTDQYRSGFEIYHVADGPPVSFEEMLNALGRELGIEVKTITIGKSAVKVLKAIPLFRGITSRIFGDLVLNTEQTVMKTAWRASRPFGGGTE